MIGGTGRLGRGLAVRWAQASLEVLLGSRSADKAAQVARELSEIVGVPIRGMSNEEASEKADVVVLTIPHEGIRNTMEKIYPNLEGKVIISTIVAPANSPKSAGEAVKELSPDSAQVASAFQNVGYKALMDLEKRVECDVVVCGDEGARRAGMELAQKIPGVRALDGGPLENSRIIESLTHMLIFLGKRYKRASPCVRFTGI